MLHGIHYVKSLRFALFVNLFWLLVAFCVCRRNRRHRHRQHRRRRRHKRQQVNVNMPHTHATKCPARLQDSNTPRPQKSSRKRMFDICYWPKPHAPHLRGPCIFSCLNARWREKLVNEKFFFSKVRKSLYEWNCDSKKRDCVDCVVTW